VRVLHFCFQHRVTKNDPTSILAVTGSWAPLCGRRGNFLGSRLPGFTINFGFLALQSGEVLTSFFAPSAAPRRLGCYVSQLPDVFNTRRVTLHVLRSGCAISLSLAGAEFPVIMQHVGWKTSATTYCSCK
jgi:hypothetical protein